MGKRLVVVGGANGVGKTTFALQYKMDWRIKYLGADLFARGSSGNMDAGEGLRAGRIFFRALQECTAGGQSVIVESTLSGVGLASRLQKLKARGYRIEMVYLFLSTVELCDERIHQRIAKGGHGVPEADVRRRYVRSLKNFRCIYRDLADTWQLLCNDLIRPIEVAFGEESDTMVIDEELYQTYLEISS